MRARGTHFLPGSYRKKALTAKPSDPARAPQIYVRTGLTEAKKNPGVAKSPVMSKDAKIEAIQCPGVTGLAWVLDCDI